MPASPFVLTAQLQLDSTAAIAALKQELAGITADAKINFGAGAAGGGIGGLNVVKWKSIENLGTAAISAADALKVLASSAEALVSVFAQLKAGAVGGVRGGAGAVAPLAAPPVPGAHSATAAGASTAYINQSVLLKHLTLAAQDVFSKQAAISDNLLMHFTAAAQKLKLLQNQIAQHQFGPTGPGFSTGTEGFNYRMQTILSAERQKARQAADYSLDPIYTGTYQPGTTAARRQAAQAAELAAFKEKMATAVAYQPPVSPDMDARAMQLRNKGADWRTQIQQWQATHKEMVAVERQAEKTGDAIAKGMGRGTRAASDFAQQMWLAAKRYAAFWAATTVGFGAVGAFAEASRAVVEFDKRMVQLDQTIDPTRSDLEATKAAILDFSVATGSSMDELGKAAVTLGQAGFQGERLREILGELANVPLLPSFDGIEQATTAIIATLGQFGDSAGSVREVLDRLNEVSNDYAVTSADLGEAIKRGGGTWRALGGTLDEYLALVTTVKQKTQESAEAIGTGLRTIASRITMPKTVAFLEGIGVQTRNAQGEILSLFELLRQTSGVYKTASPEQRRDIAEAFGGLRQVGRTIALLENFDMVVGVLNTSLTSSGSVQQDVAKGSQSLSKQLEILKARIMELIQAMAPDVFIPFVQFLTNAGNAAVSLASALSPVLKLLLEIGAALALKGLFNLGGLVGTRAGARLFGGGAAALPETASAAEIAAAGVGRVGSFPEYSTWQRTRHAGQGMGESLSWANPLLWFGLARGSTPTPPAVSRSYGAAGDQMTFWPGLNTTAPYWQAKGGRGQPPITILSRPGPAGASGEQQEFAFSGVQQNRPGGAFAQWGIVSGLAILGPALTNFAGNMVGANETLTNWTASMVRAVSSLVLITSMLRSIRPWDLIRGGGIAAGGPWSMGALTAGGLRGSLGLAARAGGAVGALAVVGGSVYKGLVEENLAEKLDEFRKAIQEIEVPDPANAPEVRQATKDFTDSLKDGIDETRKAWVGEGGALGRLKTFGMIMGTFAEGLTSLDFGKMSHALFNGDELANEAIEKNVTELIGQNLALLNGILAGSIREGGAGFQKNLQETLSAMFGDLGIANPRGLAAKVMNEMIGKAGGFAGISQIIKTQADAIRDAGLANAARQAARNLAQVIVPPALIGQLLALGTAIDLAVNRIEAKVGTWQAGTATMGGSGVTAWKTQTQVSPKAVMDMMALGALEGLPGVTPEMQQQVGVAKYIGDMATGFGRELANARQLYNKNPTRFENPMEGGGLGRGVKDFLDRYNVPEELRTQLSALLTEIGEELAKAANLDKAIDGDTIMSLVKKHMTAIIPTAEATAKLYADLMTGILQQSEARGEAEARNLERDVNIPNRPQSVMDQLRKTAKAVGINVVGGLPTDLMGQQDAILGQMDKAGERIVKGMADADQRLREFDLGIGKPKDAKEAAAKWTGLLADFERWRTLNSQYQAALALLIRAVGMTSESQADQIEQIKRAKGIINEFAAKSQKTMALLDRNYDESIRANPGQRDALWLQRKELLAMQEMQRGVVEAAQQSLAHPGDKMYDATLSQRMAEYQARLANYYQQRVSDARLSPNSEYDKNAVAQLTWLEELIDNVQKAADAFNENRLDAGAKITEEQRKGFEEALGRLQQRNEQRLVDYTGLSKDPFGAQTFQRAVAQFQGAVELLVKGEPKPANFTSVGQPVLSQLSKEQQESVARAMFGGRTQSEMIGYVNEQLASGSIPGMPAKRMTQHPFGAPQYERFSNLAEINALEDQEKRTAALTALIAAIVAEMKQSGRFDNTMPERLDALFRSNGRVSLDNFTVPDKRRDILQGTYGVPMRTPAEVETEIKARATTSQPATPPPATMPAGSVYMAPRSFVPTTPDSKGWMQTIAYRPIADDRDRPDRLNLAAPAQGTMDRMAPGSQETRDGFAVVAKVLDELKTVEQEIAGLVESIRDDLGSLRNRETDTDAHKRTGGENVADEGVLELAARLKEAVEKGVALKIESAQRVNVNVAGLDQVLEAEIKPEIELAAKRAATEIVRRALADLAAISDAEGARAFNAAARNLET